MENFVQGEHSCGPCLWPEHTGEHQDISRINLILLTPIQIKAAIASTEHTKGMWEAGVS